MDLFGHIVLLFSAVCKAGEYINQLVCAQCPVDTYQPVDMPTLDTQCLDCDENTGTVGQGTEDRSQCLGNADSIVFTAMKIFYKSLQNDRSAEPHSSVCSVADLRTGGHWFNPRLDQSSFRGLMIVIATGFIPLSWLSVAWKEYCVELLKGLQESMDRCTGHNNITEIVLKTALNTTQSTKFYPLPHNPNF